MDTSNITSRTELSKKRSSSLLVNGAALYAVQFASYILPLLTIPFLAQTLAPESWGLVMLTQGYAALLAVVLEYGFNLSASRDVAQNKSDKAILERIVSGVLGAKGLLLALTAIITLLVSWIVPTFRDHQYFLWTGWLYTVSQGLLPVWYYLGIGNMPKLASVNILARVLSTIAIFLLVRGPDDGPIVLISQATFSLMASISLILLIYRDVAFRMPDINEAIACIREGSRMFGAAAATNLYSTWNIFLLGLMVPAIQLSYFGGAEKLRGAAQTVMNPLSQVLFPLAVTKINTSLAGAQRHLWLSILAMFSIGSAMGLCLYLGAPIFITKLLGPLYVEAAQTLQILALQLPINAVNRVISMQWMLPLKMDKEYNGILWRSSIISAAMAFWLVSTLGYIGMAVSFVLTELIILIWMAASMSASGKAFWRELEPRQS